MYTYQQRLEYAKRLQRLQTAVVIKDNIHLTYKYRNRNKAINNAHSLQDKIIKSIIDDAVYGNGDVVKHVDSKIDDLMTSTLENERKRIHHDKDKYVDRAVELNAEKYSQILSNRINTESIKLQAKIESELRSGIHNGLSEAQTRKILQEKYGDTAKARIRNIIKDSIHTNESNISFINALNEGYRYKVWMNGAGKGRVRAWHRAKLIAPVPIEDYFDIYGSYHAQLMYPGDLYGGAENVANCRCWLRYTNNTPEHLKQKTNFNVSPTFQQIWEEALNPLMNVKTTIRRPIKESKINLKTQSKLDNENPIIKESIVEKLKSFFKVKLEYGWMSQTKVHKGIRIIKRQNTRFIKMEEIESLLDFLPKILLENVETIKIYGFYIKDPETGKLTLGWVAKETPHMVEIFKSKKPKQTIVHELAHILDNFFGSDEGYISGNHIWDEAYKLDKKHIKQLEEKLNFEHEFDYYVTKYALDYANLTEGIENSNVYAEDFAESVMRYLDPNDTEFKKLFPNRCKILKFILGV